MQNRLTKILALGAIALSMGACTGKAATVLQLKEVFAFADGTFSHAGERIQVKEIAVLGRYGNTLIVGQPYVEGGSIFDLQSFEVELKSQPKWKGPTEGRYANVTVTGTLENVNERPVLKKASIKVNAEAQYDENGSRIDNDGAYSAGYWSTSQITRTYWDTYMGRNQTGAVMEGIFQLASVPAAVTTSKGTEFAVVFPGENTDGTDEDNEYLINVTMPDGLSEKAVTNYNTYFGDKKSGDFVQFMGLTRYDKSKGGMGIVMENYWCGWCSEVAEADKPEVLSTWKEIQDKYDEKYLTGLPPIGAEEAGVFSYNVNNYFKEDVEELFEEDSDWILVDHDVAGLMEFSFNCGSAKVEDVHEAVDAKLLASGFVLDEELSDDVTSVYTFTYGDVVYAEVYLEDADKSVTVGFIGVRATFDTVGSLQAAIDEFAEKEEVETALTDFAASASDKIESVVLDWSGLDDLENVNTYSFRLNFKENAFADEDAFDAFLEAFEDAIEANDKFVGSRALPKAYAEGYYAASTKEFIELASGDGTYFTFYVYHLTSSAVEADEIYDITASARWNPLMFAKYSSRVWNMLGISQNGAVVYEMQGLTQDQGLDIYLGAFNGGYETTLISYAVNYALPSSAQQASNLTPVASDAYEGAQDIYVDFVLNGPEAGKLLQLRIYCEAKGTADSGYFYLDIYATVIDAPAA